MPHGTIGLLSLAIGKASIGAVRGLFGSFAFIAVAKFPASGFTLARYSF